MYSSVFRGDNGERVFHNGLRDDKVYKIYCMTARVVDPAGQLDNALIAADVQQLAFPLCRSAHA